MTGIAELGTPRLGVRISCHVERLLAVCAVERSARILTEAADAVLRIGISPADVALVGELAETLFRKVSVQDLVVIKAGGPVDLADRLTALAIGLVDGSSRLVEVRAVAPRVLVTPRIARWLTYISLEMFESYAADLPQGDVRVDLRVAMNGGMVVLNSDGNACRNAEPSLNLDRLRSVATAMGGRVVETLEPSCRRIAVSVPCRRIASS